MTDSTVLTGLVAGYRRAAQKLRADTAHYFPNENRPHERLSEVALYLFEQDDLPLDYAMEARLRERLAHLTER